MQEHFPIFAATPNGILIDGLPLNKSASQGLPPHTQRSLQRAAELLKTLKKEDWDSRTPHASHYVPTLAKAQMILALASPQPFACGKYSPDQPRMPAGNPDGGQWTDGGGANETDAAGGKQTTQQKLQAGIKTKYETVTL